jgi:hypothetical protein
MNGFNIQAIGIAIIASFVASAVYYSGFSKKRARYGLVPNPDAKHRPQPNMLAAELTRTFILAFVLAYLINQLHLTTAVDALWISLLLWLAFPFMLLSGSIMYEKFPAKVAFIHMGDWAIKLPLMMVIMTLWR